MKKHHTLIAIGVALSLLGPLVVAGLHLAGGSLVVAGIVEWCYAPPEPPTPPPFDWTPPHSE